jgi:hypothetical protein
MPAAPASTMSSVLVRSGSSASMTTDPPSVTASAVSGLRRSRKAEDSRTQPSAGNAHIS